MAAHTDRDRDVEPTIYEEATSNSLLQNTRGCFSFPCFSYRRRSPGGLPYWERVRTSEVQSDTSLWARGVRAFWKVREWSEIVAGPRWKTFIRRFNRSKIGSDGRHGQFQYDPLSYALNFDEGRGQIGNHEDDDVYSGSRAFSTRYASVPGSEKMALSQPPTTFKVQYDVTVFT